MTLRKILAEKETIPEEAKIARRSKRVQSNVIERILTLSMKKVADP